MSSNPTLSYNQASARGATPIGQIISLYDTILRDFGRALAALQAGQVETRVLELNHALIVIAHLQNVLNHERGGDAAKLFEQFYAVTRGMIVEANFQPRAESLEELINLYGGLRQAWYQAEQQSPADDKQERPIDAQPVPAAAATVNAANDDIETPQLQWSA
jgi:flagellar protein FliS